MDLTRREFVQTAIVSAAAARLVSAQQKRVRTVVGTGTAGSEQDAVDAARAPINNPYGLVIGPDSALYFCEVDTGRTRRLDLNTRTLTTIAGNGQKGYTGDGGAAVSASFTAPHEIRFDGQRNLFIVERDAHVVRRIDARTNVVSTFAGTGTAGYASTDDTNIGCDVVSQRRAGLHFGGGHPGRYCRARTSFHCISSDSFRDSGF